MHSSVSLPRGEITMYLEDPKGLKYENCAEEESLCFLSVL
jgi:hypothetical protein